MTDPATSLPGPALAWREAGHGRPVVLLHAFPADSRMFAAQLEAASDRLLPVRLVTPDLPGFGRSPLPDPPPGVLAVEMLAETLSAFLRALDLPRAVIGGVAIGGYLAIEFAARFPEHVDGLVLVGTKPAPDPPANLADREAVARTALSRGAQAVAAELTDQPFAAQTPPETRVAFRQMIEDADPRGIAGLVRGLHRRPDPSPSVHTLAAARLPVLVMVGAEDPFTSPASARRLADMLPGASFSEVAGAGHLPPLEQPDEVSRELADFIAALPE